MTTNSSSCMLLPSSLQIRGGPVGKGGHNSDEALLAAGSYQLTRRPTRPPLDEQSGDEPPGPTGLGKDTDGQLHGRSGPKQARPHPASSLLHGYEQAARRCCLFMDAGAGRGCRRAPADARSSSNATASVSTIDALAPVGIRGFRAGDIGRSGRRLFVANGVATPVSQAGLVHKVVAALGGGPPSGHARPLSRGP